MGSESNALFSRKDPETHGSMFVLVILGSDKTTVSVTTVIWCINVHARMPPF